MKSWTFALAFIGSVCLFGCDSSGGGTGGGAAADAGAVGELSLPDLIAQSSAQTCEFFERCFPGFEAVLGAQCGDNRDQFLAQRQLPAAEQSIADGMTQYVAENARACLDELTQFISEVSCDLDSAFGPGGLGSLESCDATFVPLAELGEACRSSDHCVGDAYCSLTDMCPGRCVMTVGEGVECDDSEQCSSGLVCHGGPSEDAPTCKTPIVDGAECQPEGTPCVAGTSCIVDGPAMEGATGVCGATEVTLSGVGEACDFASNRLCESGLSCVFVIAEGQTPTQLCREVGAIGDVCSIGFPNPCGTGAYCADLDLAAQDFEGECAALPGDGEACLSEEMSAGLLCAPGFVCDGAEDARVCGVAKNIGEPCTLNEACFSGNCNSGACAPGDDCVDP